MRRNERDELRNERRNAQIPTSQGDKIQRTNQTRKRDKDKEKTKIRERGKERYKEPEGKGRRENAEGTQRERRGNATKKRRKKKKKNLCTFERFVVIVKGPGLNTQLFLNFSGCDCFESTNDSCLNRTSRVIRYKHGYLSTNNELNHLL